MSVLAGVMLVGMGAWPWVVWPFVFYWYTNHVAASLKLYVDAAKPIVTNTTETSPQVIADAAVRAFGAGSELEGYHLRSER